MTLTLKALGAGQTLRRSLQGRLPPIAVQIIRTGEQTGNLDAAFQRLSEYYEGELERSLRQLQGILRPLSLLATSGLVVTLLLWAIALLISSFPG